MVDPTLAPVIGPVDIQLAILEALRIEPLKRFMEVMSGLEHLGVYMVIISLVFWLRDKRTALYLVGLVVISGWLDASLKHTFHAVRPAFVNDFVPLLERAYYPTDFSFPSGHSLMTMAFGAGIAVEMRNRWVTLCALVLVGLVGLSRLVLGVHWPADVLGGWAIGGLLMYGFHLSRRFWRGELASALPQLLWVAAISGFMLVTGLLSSVDIAPVPAPVNPLWAPELPGQPVYQGLRAGSDSLWLFAGMYICMWVGSLLEERFVQFDPRVGTPRTQLLKVAVGAALMAAVWLAAGLISAPTWLRLALAVFTATLIAPWVFKRLLKVDAGAQDVNRVA